MCHTSETQDIPEPLGISSSLGFPFLCWELALTIPTRNKNCIPNRLGNWRRYCGVIPHSLVLILHLQFQTFIIVLHHSSFILGGDTEATWLISFTIFISVFQVNSFTTEFYCSNVSGMVSVLLSLRKSVRYHVY